MIDTAICKICGTTVMRSFLHEHMSFVHNSKLKKSKNKHEKLTNKNKKYLSGKIKKQVRCILCGQYVEPGNLLNHKTIVHGENPLAGSTVGKPSASIWVKVYQGGSPGLGKKHS